jgi:hypothetical protein
MQKGTSKVGSLAPSVAATAARGGALLCGYEFCGTLDQQKPASRSTGSRAILTEHDTASNEVVGSVGQNQQRTEKGSHHGAVCFARTCWGIERPEPGLAWLSLEYFFSFFLNLARSFECLGDTTCFWQCFGAQRVNMEGA